MSWWLLTLSAILAGIVVTLLGLIAKWVWTEIREAKADREAAALTALKAQIDRDVVLDALKDEPDGLFQKGRPGLFTRVAILEAAPGESEWATRMETKVDTLTVDMGDLSNAFREHVDGASEVIAQSEESRAAFAQHLADHANGAAV